MYGMTRWTASLIVTVLILPMSQVSWADAGGVAPWGTVQLDPGRMHMLCTCGGACSGICVPLLCSQLHPCRQLQQHVRPRRASGPCLLAVLCSQLHRP
jgi:hypothetical protein